MRRQGKTPITYYGGKQRMLRHLLPLLPEHDLYTEAFCGGAALYWAKAPARVEVINDLNGEVVNFYRVLKADYQALKELVNDTLHSRRSYYDALVMYERPWLFDELQRAWAFWMLTCEGFGSKPESWGYDRQGTVTKKLFNAIEGFGPHLAERLQRTQIECNDALRVIESRDREGAFHYVDPPYYNSDCGHYKGYGQADFEALLDLLARLKGKWLLSSYPSDVLAQAVALHGWHQKTIEQTVAVSQRAAVKKKWEVLTGNFPLC